LTSQQIEPPSTSIMTVALPLPSGSAGGTSCAPLNRAVSVTVSSAAATLLVEAMPIAMTTAISKSNRVRMGALLPDTPPRQRRYGGPRLSGLRAPARGRFGAHAEEETFVADEASRLDKGSASRLLGDWRAAERDTVAARESADTAALAASAAETASRAADETAEASRLALEAATRAERAARETADAARILSTTAAADKLAATTGVESAEAAESAARDAFHTAQDAGFPRAGQTTDQDD
jgi:hypothetical protein